MSGMLLVDPEGLFLGRRLSQCSDQARLIWTYLYLASNAYGRLELNEALIHSRAFGTFREKPRLGNAVVEFVRTGLLFLYVEPDTGKLWGQWDTPERCLPKYKTARDRRSPAPDSKAFEHWRRSRIPQRPGDFQNFFENFFEKFPAAVAVAVAGAESITPVVGTVENVQKPAHEGRKGNGNINQGAA
jgi:hypothetical protein